MWSPESWWTICWNWLFSTCLWCVNIKQFVFMFQHHKVRHFIACRSSWMIRATRSPPTLVLPLLFLYSLPLLSSTDVWLFYQRVAQGYRNEERQAHACPQLCLGLQWHGAEVGLSSGLDTWPAWELLISAAQLLWFHLDRAKVFQLDEDWMSFAVGMVCSVSASQCAPSSQTDVSIWEFVFHRDPPRACSACV